MLSRIRARVGHEGGSVVAAVCVVAAVAMLLAALTATVHGSMRSLVIDRGRIAALQDADAGVALAVYRLDSGRLGGGSYQTTPTGFTDRVESGDLTFEVTAWRETPDVDHTWLVRSEGSDASGQRRVVLARVARPPLVPFAYFTDGAFSLSGQQTSPTAYDSRTCPLGSPSCQLAQPVPGDLGTNATFDGANATIEAFKAGWRSFSMYGRASQAAADAACAAGRCGTSPKVRAITNRYEPERPAVPATVQPCPGGGAIEGGAVPAGDYLCPSLALQGTITVSGAGPVRIWVDGDVSAAPGAVVNAARPSTSFQILQSAEGDPAAGSICGAELWAVLFLPRTAIACSGGGQPRIWGAVVAASHAGTGAHFDFHWDLAATTVSAGGRYEVTDWRECPVRSASC